MGKIQYEFKNQLLTPEFDMTDDYMRDPRAKTIEGFIVGLTLLSKYMKDGMKETCALGGEHDVIWFSVSTEQLLEESEDGKLLVCLGFHTEDDTWQYFT